MSTDNANTILLQIWEGDYGLGSIQPESLIIMTYLKFTGLPVLYHVSNTPVLHNLPNITLPDAYVENYDNIFGVIYQMDHSVDKSLTILDMSKLRAYRSYFKGELAIIFYTTFWIMDENYFNLTRTWHRKAMKFPLGFIYPYYFRRTLINEYRSVLEGDDMDIVVRASLKRAHDIIDELSTLLENKMYLFGDHLTSLDAVAFGYIAPLLKAPLRERTVQAYILSKRNIVMWVERINNKFYEEMPVKYKHVPERNRYSFNKETNAASKLFITAGLVFGVAMIGYTTLCGIIRFAGRQASAIRTK